MGHDDLASRSERARLVNVREVSVRSRRVARRHGVAAESRGLGPEAGSVGSRLGSQLGKVQVGTGTVSHVHRLHETAFGVESVEDDAVERDTDDLDDHFDDDADEGPVLQAADKCIVYFFVINFRALVVRACPSPHVFIAAVVLAVLEDDGCGHPQKHT